jgi:hypothetical protein
MSLENEQKPGSFPPGFQYMIPIALFPYQKSACFLPYALDADYFRADRQCV